MDRLDDDAIAALDRLATLLRCELSGELAPGVRRQHEADLAEVERRIVAASPSVPLEALGLSARTVSALQRSGIGATDDLALVTSVELAALPGIGPERMLELQRAFYRHRAARVAGDPGPAEVVRSRRP